MPQLANLIEAILYLKGRPLPIARIAEYAGCDREAAEEGLMELMDQYAHREGALELVETQEGYCLQLKAGFKHLVDTLIPLDLGVGALRTLAAIALRGPMSQTDLVEVRGSGVYQHVQELVKLGFVTKRRQADGRSFWLQVTNKFHQYFEMDQLPALTRRPQAAAAPPTDTEDTDSSETSPPLLSANSEGTAEATAE